MTENHYDVIGNIAGFTCLNASGNKSRDIKCKACKNKTICNTEEPQVSCIKSVVSISTANRVLITT